MAEPLIGGFEDDQPAASGDVAGGRLFQRWWAECMAQLVVLLPDKTAALKTACRSAWWAGWTAARTSELVELTSGIVVAQARRQERPPSTADLDEADRHGRRSEPSESSA